MQRFGTRFVMILAIGALMAGGTPARAAQEPVAPGRVVAHAGVGYGVADLPPGTDQSMAFAFEAAWLFRLGESGFRAGPRAELAGYSTFHPENKLTRGTLSFGGGAQFEYDTQLRASELFQTDYQWGVYVFFTGGGLQATSYDKRGTNEIQNSTTSGGLSVGGGVNCFIGDGLYAVVGLSAAYARGFGKAESDNLRLLAQLGFAFD